MKKRMLRTVIAYSLGLIYSFISVIVVDVCKCRVPINNSVIETVKFSRLEAGF